MIEKIRMLCDRLMKQTRFVPSRFHLVPARGQTGLSNEWGCKTCARSGDLGVPPRPPENRLTAFEPIVRYIFPLR